MSKSRPLVYQWIAHYNDGTGYPQFDTKTGKENSFLDIDKDRLIKFGLYHIKKEQADIINKSGNNSVVSLEFLPTYEIKLKDYERVIYYRDVFISQEAFHRCRTCNKEFHYDGILRHVLKEKDLKLGIKRAETCPICPHCGSHDYFKCRNCGKIFNTYNEADYGMCQDCGRLNGYLERIVLTSGSLSRERRWIEYYIGKQSTIQGTNIKTILKIKENGNCTIL